MTPAMQTVIVVAIVLAALAYVGRRAWSTLAKGKQAEGGSCKEGCHK
jgi:hypothetical protein